MKEVVGMKVGKVPKMKKVGVPGKMGGMRKKNPINMTKQKVKLPGGF